MVNFNEPHDTVVTLQIKEKSTTIWSFATTFPKSTAAVRYEEKAHLHFLRVEYSRRGEEKATKKIVFSDFCSNLSHKSPLN